MDFSDNLYFGGNIMRQCSVGTYPDYRDHYISQLQLAVNEGHMTAEDMKLKLDEADSMWAKAKKDPNVIDLMNARIKDKADKEEAILRSASVQVSDLRGSPVTVQVVEPVKKAK